MFLGSNTRDDNITRSIRARDQRAATVMEDLVSAMSLEDSVENRLKAFDRVELRRAAIQAEHDEVILRAVDLVRQHDRDMYESVGSLRQMVDLMHTNRKHIRDAERALILSESFRDKRSTANLVEIAVKHCATFLRWMTKDFTLLKSISQDPTIKRMPVVAIALRNAAEAIKTELNAVKLRYRDNEAWLLSLMRGLGDDVSTWETWDYHLHTGDDVIIRRHYDDPFRVPASTTEKKKEDSSSEQRMLRLNNVSRYGLHHQRRR